MLRISNNVTWLYFAYVDIFVTATLSDGWVSAGWTAATGETCSCVTSREHPDSAQPFTVEHRIGDSTETCSCFIGTPGGKGRGRDDGRQGQGFDKGNSPFLQALQTALLIARHHLSSTWPSPQVPGGAVADKDYFQRTEQSGGWLGISDYALDHRSTVTRRPTDSAPFLSCTPSLVLEPIIP